MKWLVTAAALAFTPAAAQSEVVSSNPNGFHVRHSVQIVAPVPNAYDAFGQVSSWWDKAHTYSGDSANLSLSISPGGCFCERIPAGGGIEHMRVVFVDPGKRVVLTGSLGPLLYQATTGVMDVQFERIAGGSQVILDYRVAGFAQSDAQKVAPLVDAVLAEQMRGYRQFARSRAVKR